MTLSHQTTRCTTTLELAMNFREENIKVRVTEILNVQSLDSINPLLQFILKVFLLRYQMWGHRCSLPLQHDNHNRSVGLGLVK